MNKTENRINLFREIFKGREDVVTQYWESRDSHRNGYSPLCYNEWKKGICHKPCRTCDNADYIPLSDNLILDHFKGKRRLGIYPLNIDEKCNFITVDFDGHSNEGAPQRDAREFYEVCNLQDIPSYLIRSKSGKGIHSYSFFEASIKAEKVRKVWFALLEEAGIDLRDPSLSSFDRLFPNQDRISGRGFGNCISLPFHGGSAKDEHTIFLDPETSFEKPYEDQFNILKNIIRVNEKKLDDLIEEWDLDSADYGKNPQFEGNSEHLKKIMSCRFIDYCKTEPAKIKEPLWWAMISNVSAIRPGGYSLCHELSKKYPDYSRSETDAKIHHVMDSSRPHTCAFIRKQGFKCDRDCSVRSPIGLIYKKN